MMAMREIKYEVSEPSDGLSVWVDDADFEGLDPSDISDQIGEAIHDDFLERVSWHASERADVVAAIVANSTIREAQNDPSD